MIERTIAQLALAAGIGMALSTTAHAQVVRFVASYGNDANLCTRTQPCRNLQRGHDVTPSGGELQILDSGTFGLGLTITKSITISAVGVTAIAAASTGAAITIKKQGSVDPVVVLRGLRVQGGPSAERGIHIMDSSTVYLEDCVVEGFNQAGIDGNSRQFALRVTARHNSQYGLKGGHWVILDSRFGVQYPSTGAWVNDSTIIDSTSSDSTFAGFALIRSTAVGSTVENSHRGFYVPSYSWAVIERSVATRNTFGVKLDTLSAAQYSSVTVSNSLLTENDIGIDVDNDPSIENTRSLGNNTVSGNETDLTGAVVPVSPR